MIFFWGIQNTFKKKEKNFHRKKNAGKWKFGPFSGEVSLRWVQKWAILHVSFQNFFQIHFLFSNGLWRKKRKFRTPSTGRNAFLSEKTKSKIFDPRPISPIPTKSDQFRISWTHMHGFRIFIESPRGVHMLLKIGKVKKSHVLSDQTYYMPLIWILKNLGKFKTRVG